MFEHLIAYFKHPVVIFSLCFSGVYLFVVGIIVGIVSLIEKIRGKK